MNKENGYFYFFPIFLVLYFIIAWTPLALDLKNREFFPFFAFNLYSFLPDKIDKKILWIEANDTFRIFNHYEMKEISIQAKIELDKNIELCVDNNDCTKLQELLQLLKVQNVKGILQYEGYYYQVARGEKLPSKVIKYFKNG